MTVTVLGYLILVSIDFYDFIILIILLSIEKELEGISNTQDGVRKHISNHLKVRQKYSTARRTFNSLLGVRRVVDEHRGVWKCGLRWPNTVFARALADAIQCAHKQKQTCSIFAIFFAIERSALMTLVFYNKGMLKKVTMQRTQQFSDFSKSKETS